MKTNKNKIETIRLLWRRCLTRAIGNAKDMIENILTWLITGGMIGWFAKKLFGPTVDNLGVRLSDAISLLFDKEKESLELYGVLEKLLHENHRTNGYKKFVNGKSYRNNTHISVFFEKYGVLMLHSIKHKWIECFAINSYADADVFYAGLDLLFPQLSKKDVLSVFDKHKDNDQAHICWWIQQIEERKPKLVTHDIVKYCEVEQTKKN